MNRLTFPLLLLFWGVMMFLLWRSEYGETGDFGTPIPVESVWQRMLTAPDDSALEIRHGRDRIGRIVWAPNVARKLQSGNLYDPGIEGRVLQATYYSIDLDGVVQPTEELGSFRISSQVRFELNHAWQYFALRLSQRPNRWLISADSTNRTVELTAVQNGEEWQRIIPFDALRQPQRLLLEIAAPWAGGLLLGALPVGNLSPERIAAGMKWDARQDWFEIANSRLRAHRLRLQVTDNLRVTVYVSRAGEILRADFPDRWVLINEKFTSY